MKVSKLSMSHSGRGIFAFCQDNTGKGEYIEGMCLDLAKRNRETMRNWETAEFGSEGCHCFLGPEGNRWIINVCLFHYRLSVGILVYIYIYIQYICIHTLLIITVYRTNYVELFIGLVNIRILESESGSCCGQMLSYVFRNCWMWWCIERWWAKKRGVDLQ